MGHVPYARGAIGDRVALSLSLCKAHGTPIKLKFITTHAARVATESKTARGFKIG